MSGSITHWLLQLRSGNRTAAQPLWDNYFTRMVRLARRHLNGSPRSVVDEEDVVVNAFDSFCRAAEQGRFPKLDDSTDLWRVLVVITERKAVNQAKFVTRKKRVPAGRTVSYLDSQHGDEMRPSPWFSARVAEICTELLESLDDETLQSIAVWKMEGFSNDEIATKLDCSRRSIERKLALIRHRWLEADDS